MAGLLAGHLWLGASASHLEAELLFQARLELATNPQPRRAQHLQFELKYPRILFEEIQEAPDAMDPSNDNPLLSKQTASGSSFQVALHPLALLTISDYITRHEVRQMKGPVVGALLGQQTGRSITIEHAFEARTISSDSGIILDEGWFKKRLDQSKNNSTGLSDDDDKILTASQWYKCIRTETWSLSAGSRPYRAAARSRP